MAASRHEMPFGSRVMADGSVRFRLWAPAAKHVDLHLETGRGEILLPMHEAPGGWYSLTSKQASHGSRYFFIVDGRDTVTDPASRFQPRGVHGPSQVVDPWLWSWRDGDWAGRPWREAVIYELHVGSFTRQGDFQAVTSRLDYLEDLGITAVELMPVAEFPGTRNWGYDGVLPFAPASCYGGPDALKALVQSAHDKGLMVLLDVVYNHFGPEGNHLHRYAPGFFTAGHHTPWGMAINFDGEDSRIVREFFIHNALYWLQEFHFDGLRLDAVHTIFDDSKPDILEELAVTVQSGPGRHRHIHLIVENDDNEAYYLGRTPARKPQYYTAQWNDDLHHALHVLITGETTGYYRDYAEMPVRHLGRALTEGFAYQGESSRYRGGAPRGTPSRHLPPDAFIGFLQNHDQIGNRAFGERIGRLAPLDAIRAATAIVLLAPGIPLMFMGQEWGTVRPFPYFCDFEVELGRRVAEGRREEFSRFPEFAGTGSRSRIPDPNDPGTFDQAVLDRETADASWLAFHKRLLRLRRDIVVPLIDRLQASRGQFQCLSGCALIVNWGLDGGGGLQLCANLGDEAISDVPVLRQTPFFQTSRGDPTGMPRGTWPSWLVTWSVTES